MDVCEHEAITQNAKTGVYMIDKKKCVGCGKCAEVCPTDTICKSEENEYTTKCTSCGICAKACPMGILEVVDK